MRNYAPLTSEEDRASFEEASQLYAERMALPLDEARLVVWLLTYK